MTRPDPRTADIDKITTTVEQFEQILRDINDAHQKLAVLQGELGNPVEALRVLGYAVNEHWHKNRLYATDLDRNYIKPEANAVRDLSDRIAALVKVFTPSTASGFDPAGTQHVTYGAAELTYKKEQFS